VTAPSFLGVLAQVIHTVIQAYIIIIIIRSVISWMGYIPPNLFIRLIYKITDPVFRFIHRVFPFTISGGIDFSPIVILLALYLVDHLAMRLIYGYAQQFIPGR